jgi:glycosyltransferase involved in cell wall biosynthesis
MVTVLLATYNGKAYLPAQLDSLFAQTFQDFELRVCDDCSADGSITLLRQYAEKYPGRISITSNPVNSGSAKHNFTRMITSTQDDYIFLCDQDDWWYPDKLEKSIAKLRDMESIYGTSTPLLAHTDLSVVDKELKIIAPSYREQVVHPDWLAFDFKQSLVMNIATGSTIGYNRALAELLKKPIEYCVMHDWWILQTAFAFGQVGHIFDQTVKYRQHDSNELGSSNVRSFEYKFRRFLHGRKVRERFQNSYEQAKAFRNLYIDKLDNNQLALLNTYCGIGGFGKLHRLRTLFSLGVINYGVSRKIATILFA